MVNIKVTLFSSGDRSYITKSIFHYQPSENLRICIFYYVRNSLIKFVSGRPCFISATFLSMFTITNFCRRQHVFKSAAANFLCCHVNKTTSFIDWKQGKNTGFHVNIGESVAIALHLDLIERVTPWAAILNSAVINCEAQIPDEQISGIHLQRKEPTDSKADVNEPNRTWRCQDADFLALFSPCTNGLSLCGLSPR